MNNLFTSFIVDNSIKYAGYQYDDETGYYYLNSRMYDPITARFLQEDTYTGEPNDPLSLNLYTYTKNNPLIYVDPTGHRPIEGADSTNEDWSYEGRQKNATSRIKKINRDVQIRQEFVSEIQQDIDDMWGNEYFATTWQEVIDNQSSVITGLIIEKAFLLTKYDLEDIEVEVEIDLSPWDNEKPGFFEQVWDNIADGACKRWDKKYDSFYDFVNFASFGRVESVNDSFYRMMHRDMYDVFTLENGMDTLNVAGEFYMFGQVGAEAGNIISNAAPVLNGGGASTSPSEAWSMYDDTVDANLLENIEYSPKVIDQMSLGDYHGFPDIVDNYGGYGIVKNEPGGDEIVRTVVEISGEYMGKKGVFQYIIENNGYCNHRMFIPIK